MPAEVTASPKVLDHWWGVPPSNFATQKRKRTRRLLGRSGFCKEPLSPGLSVRRHDRRSAASAGRLMGLFALGRRLARISASTPLARRPDQKDTPAADLAGALPSAQWVWPAAVETARHGDAEPSARYDSRRTTTANLEDCSRRATSASNNEVTVNCQPTPAVSAAGCPKIEHAMR
jgi:hypothetical protein